MLGPIDQEIESRIGTAVAEVKTQQGGSVGEVYRVLLEDGREAIVKVDRRKTPNLDVEAYMLDYLAQHSTLPVPAVLYSAPELVAMEFLAGDSHFSENAQLHAAELLADLHGIRAERFGLERDTLIGSLDQPNPFESSWVEFFRDHRLLHFAQQAHAEGRLDTSLLGRIDKFAERLDKWIHEPEHPSLLHGDVWTTNVLADDHHITGFLDPAIYFGHPEIELAFITLFSTFGPAFFNRYNQLRPIESGFFEVRRDIYNLYPLLVHVRLFGGGYVGGVERTLEKFGF